jgi:hypothetical protein
MGQCDFSTIMKAFLTLLPQLLEDFFQKVLFAFGEYEMAQDKKSFACKCCGNDTKFIWKTRHGKATTILTGSAILRSNSCRWSARGAAASSTSPGCC